MSLRSTAVSARRREPLLALTAMLAGIAIAYVDSRPGWDTDAITVFALLSVAFACAFLAGRRPWLFGLLVGVWTPLLEVPSGAAASLIALVFSTIGAFTGYLVASSARKGG